MLTEFSPAQLVCGSCCGAGCVLGVSSAFGAASGAIVGAVAGGPIGAGLGASIGAATSSAALGVNTIVGVGLTNALGMEAQHPVVKVAGLVIGLAIHLGLGTLIGMAFIGSPLTALIFSAQMLIPLCVLSVACSVASECCWLCCQEFNILSDFSGIDDSPLQTGSTSYDGNDYGISPISSSSELYSPYSHVVV